MVHLFYVSNVLYLLTTRLPLWLGGHQAWTSFSPLAAFHLHGFFLEKTKNIILIYTFDNVNQLPLLSKSFSCWQLHSPFSPFTLSHPLPLPPSLVTTSLVKRDVLAFVIIVLFNDYCTAQWMNWTICSWDLVLAAFHSARRDCPNHN